MIVKTYYSITIWLQKKIEKVLDLPQFLHPVRLALIDAASNDKTIICLNIFAIKNSNKIQTRCRAFNTVYFYLSNDFHRTDNASL